MSASTRRNTWVRIQPANPSAQLRLFCFPYAGGSAASFHGWKRGLPEWVEVYPVHLPGRGARALESPYTELLPLAEAAAAALTPHLDRPYALFGHSMGALIAFEVARRMRRAGAPRPVHLFASACRAPQLNELRGHTYDMPHGELIRALRRLNGTPQTILDSEEMMEFFVPLIRADLQLVQTYVCPPGPPLSCPLSVFGGLQDSEETPERLAPWREQTDADFELLMFEGDHFFLHTQAPLLLESIGRRLARAVAAEQTMP
ncbi:MAG TPA: alpha/beta fold hydrolase [Pyrinomonadaceae bacterium]|jgi:medium-chain acyl-[acyl-carrier-protein] hydrolase